MNNIAVGMGQARTWCGAKQASNPGVITWIEFWGGVRGVNRMP